MRRRFRRKKKSAEVVILKHCAGRRCFMRLDQLIPLTTLTHTLWRSTLGDFCVFYGLDVAEELQDAELYQHQGIMITARVLLCYFVGDAAAIGCPSRYIKLQEFVESSMPQSLK